MKHALVVALNAERQIREAARWWQRNRPAAADLFRSELARGFELITTQPGLGEPARDLDLPDLRRVHLSRIRYHLYYRVESPDAVTVVALWHTARGSMPAL